MKLRGKIYFLIFLILSFIVLLLSINIRNTRLENNLKKVDNSSIKLNNKDNITTNKNIMIVAHPDDEILWGGAHLLEDDYMVVCVTCGTVNERAEEFKNAMKLTGDEYIILGYPDVVDGKISDWKSLYDVIEKHLVNIIEEGHYNKIVTHNPEGEYGHIQHKMLNRMVTDNVDKNRLYYFGKYYEKNKVPSDLREISSDALEIKTNKLLNVYKTQASTINKLKHMHKHENWVQYYDWYNPNGMRIS